MDVTFFSGLFGPVMLAAGIGLLINQKSVPKIIADFTKSPALMMLGGAFSILIGVWIVREVNVWELNEAGLITLIGWASVVKGVLLLFVPSFVVETATSCSKSGGLMATAHGLITIAGAWLTYLAYFV